MQKVDPRNPKLQFRVVAVAVVYAVIGATVGGIAATLLGGFYVCVLLGTSIGAMSGACSEANRSRG